MRTKILGEINAPSSKSVLQRAIIMAYLAEEETILQKVVFCEDALWALGIVKNLGVEVSFEKDSLIINSKNKIKNFKEIFVGESGLLTRIVVPVLALKGKNFIIQGKGSLLGRPMDFQALQNLGVKCKTTNSYLPLEFSGKLIGGTCFLDGSVSSQLLSGLLLALPKAEQDSFIKVKNLKSIPYVDLTLQMLKDFGIDIQNEDYTKFFIQGRQKYKKMKYEIEGDYSSAASFLVMGAVFGNIKINALKKTSLQADKKILNVLEKVGANLEIQDNYVIVQKNKLHPFEFDATHCPDLFPPLVALASFCSGTSKMKGVSRLLHKESNRALTLQEEFGKLGIKIDLKDDDMFIHPAKPKLNKVSSHNDHRIAMALAVIGLSFEEELEIIDKDSVRKSYPLFFEDLKKIKIN